MATTQNGMTTTYNAIRDKVSFPPGFGRIQKEFEREGTGDDVFPFRKILNLIGIKYSICYFAAIDGFEREKRLFTVWCAKWIKHLMTDERTLEALQAAERFAEDTLPEDQRMAIGMEAVKVIGEGIEIPSESIDELVEKYAAQSVLCALNKDIDNFATQATNAVAHAAAWAAIRDLKPFLLGMWAEDDLEKEPDVDRIIMEAKASREAALSLNDDSDYDADAVDASNIPERIATTVRDTWETTYNAAWVAMRKEFTRMLDCLEKQERYTV